MYNKNDLIGRESIMKKTLKTKRNVEVRQMSIDECTLCDDLQGVLMRKDGSYAAYGQNSSIVAWIRKGLVSGDFKTKMNGTVPDDVIRELSEEERIELASIIKEHQSLGK